MIVSTFLLFFPGQVFYKYGSEKMIKGVGNIIRFKRTHILVDVLGEIELML